MASIFNKLNLKEQKEILVVHAPESFNSELDALSGVTIRRNAQEINKISFALVFVTRQIEVSATVKAIGKKIEGDAIIWFAYPKGTSKKYSCDFNRDTGWDVLGEAGFERVRQVAIDEDWTALRFRRVEFIKTMTRRKTFALTKLGKAKTL
jgi:hypothetical protein